MKKREKIIIDKEKEINNKLIFLDDKENCLEKGGGEINNIKKNLKKDIEENKNLKQENKNILKQNKHLINKNKELEKEISLHPKWKA